MVNAMLFYVLLTENLKLPSDNWSKEFVTQEYKSTDVVIYDVIYPSVFSAAYNNQIISAYYSEKKVIVNILDEKLNKLNSFSTDIEINDLSKMSGFIDKDELILYLQSKDGSQIFQYRMNLKTNEFIEKNYYEDDINLISLYNQYALIFNHDKLILWNGKEVIEIEYINKAEMISIYEKNGDFNVLTIESKMGSDRKIKRYIIDDYKLKFITDISSLENGSNLSLVQFETYVSDDHIKILTKLRSNKFNQNFINIFNYDDESNEILLHDQFSNEMSMNNLKLIDSNKNEIRFIQSYPVSLGMTDISKKDKVYFNLFMEIYDKDGSSEIKQLTKTEYLSSHPNYFIMNGYEYLQWSEIFEGQNSILFSSNQPELIEKSTQLSKQSLLNLLWSTFSCNMLMFYFFLFIAVSIIMPIVFTIIPVSLIFFNWSEKNQDKLFLIAIGIHILSKFNYVYNFIKDNKTVLLSLPGILSNQYFQYGISMFTTVIAYYCLIDYMKNKNIKNFLFKYLFFFFIDILLLVLVLVPYRML